MGEAVELEAGGRTVRLSSPGKIFFPERGFTKLDLARYYIAVGPGILRALRDRPTTLERYPDGVEGENFFQKRAPKNMPDWIPTAHITFPSGRSADEMCPTEQAAVLWAAQYGTLTFHPWPVRRDDVDSPDELRIDLDPQPGTDYDDAVRAAHELRAVLDEFGGLKGFPKTSGGRGLHVFVPIEPRWTFTQVRRAAIAVGRELARRMPDQVTVKWWKEERGERIFVDYNQTARDRTIASAYSVRPRPHAPVSAPLRWDEVGTAHPRLRPRDDVSAFRRTRRRARGHGRPPLLPGRPPRTRPPGRTRPRAGGSAVSAGVSEDAGGAEAGAAEQGEEGEWGGGRSRGRCGRRF